jgi:hypothetical protein
MSIVRASFTLTAERRRPRSAGDCELGRLLWLDAAALRRQRERELGIVLGILRSAWLPLAHSIT